MGDQPTNDLTRIAERSRAAWAERTTDDYINSVVRQMTSGTTTDWGTQGVPPPSDLFPISLGAGIPDAETVPRAQLAEAVRRVLEPAGDAPLVYGGPRGYKPLREEIASFFARNHPAQPSADWYLMTNGAAGAIEAVCSALLDPGDVVIAEVPTFAGSLRTLIGKQARVVGVEMDDDGIRIDRLEAALDQIEADGDTAKLIYTQPTFHNPTGLTMSLQRRIDLLDVAARRGVFVMEDHAYSELYFDGPPPTTLSELSHGYGVFTVGTFSKVIATGLRIGWVQARPEWINTLLPARFDMGNSPLLHRMLHEYMVRGDFHAHVEAMRRLYAQKAGMLGAALHEFGEPYFELTPPAGGFFLWLRLHDGVAAAEVSDAAARQGIFFATGDRFYPRGYRGDNGDAIRLAYSWPALPLLEEAGERLNHAFTGLGG